MKKNKEIVRYLIWGVIAILLNFFLFIFFSQFLNIIWANTTTFFICILFTYYTNSKFVFFKRMNFNDLFQFGLLRISGIFIENFILYIFIFIGINQYSGKIFSSAIIIIWNYICSKFFIFK